MLSGNIYQEIFISKNMIGVGIWKCKGRMPVEEKNAYFDSLVLLGVNILWFMLHSSSDHPYSVTICKRYIFQCGKSIPKTCNYTRLTWWSSQVIYGGHSLSCRLIFRTILSGIRLFLPKRMTVLRLNSSSCECVCINIHIDVL